MCIAEVCATEVCATEVCATEMTPGEGCLGEVCLPQICSVEGCATEVCPAEVCATEGGRGEVRYYIRIDLSPLVPHLYSSLEYREMFLVWHSTHLLCVRVIPHSSQSCRSTLWAPRPLA